MTSRRKKVATPVKPHKEMGRRIRILPSVQNPVKNQADVPNDAEEQTSAPFEKENKQTNIHVKIEMDDMMTQNQVVVPNDAEEQTVVPFEKEQQ